MSKPSDATFIRALKLAVFNDIAKTLRAYARAKIARGEQDKVEVRPDGFVLTLRQ